MGGAEQTYVKVRQTSRQGGPLISEREGSRSSENRGESLLGHSITVLRNLECTTEQKID